MSTAENHVPPDAEGLQFDHAEFETAAQAGLVCRVCNQPISDAYYEVNQSVVCDQCRQALEERFQGKSGGSVRFLRAILFGGLAAIGGGILLYAFGALTGLSVGIVSIFVGHFVGRAVFKGSDSRGGLRYQFLAVFLTYSAVACSYLPVAASFIAEIGDKAKAKAELKNGAESPKEGQKPGVAGVEKVAADTAKAKGKTSEKIKAVGGPAAKEEKQPTPGEIVLAVVIVSAVCVVLAYLVPFLTLSQSFITLLIILFGLMQAWKTNRRPAFGPWAVPDWRRGAACRRGVAHG